MSQGSPVALRRCAPQNHRMELRTRLTTSASAVVRLRRAHPGRWASIKPEINDD
jgi:hypothetical protein